MGHPALLTETNSILTGGTRSNWNLVLHLGIQVEGSTISCWRPLPPTVWTLTRTSSATTSQVPRHLPSHKPATFKVDLALSPARALSALVVIKAMFTKYKSRHHAVAIFILRPPWRRYLNLLNRLCRICFTGSAGKQACACDSALCHRT